MATHCGHLSTGATGTTSLGGRGVRHATEYLSEYSAGLLHGTWWLSRLSQVVASVLKRTAVRFYRKKLLKRQKECKSFQLSTPHPFLIRLLMLQLISRRQTVRLGCWDQWRILKSTVEWLVESLQLSVAAEASSSIGRSASSTNRPLLFISLSDDWLVWWGRFSCSLLIGLIKEKEKLANE